MKTCALAPLNKADTFFGGNGGASSSQKCHHNYYTAAVHSSLKSGKKGEKFGCNTKSVCYKIALE